MRRPFGRKGQVAIFIAAGIVVLLLLAIFISQNPTPSQQSSYQVTEQIDTQFSAVRTFVQSCLEQTANTALDKIGQQGGYIDPKAAGIVAGYPGKQKTDGFPFVAGSNIVLPYWYYLNAPMDCSGNCYNDSKAPDLDGPDKLSIQSQMQDYIAANLATCLGNFGQLSDQGFNVTQAGAIAATVQFRDNDTHVYLEYPLQASFGDKTQRITQYSTDLQVPLRSLYKYASLLSTAQAQNSYLEYEVLSFISLNSGPSMQLLPPTTATTYDYVSTVFWLKSKVRQQLQDSILPRVNSLQVANARNVHSVVYNNPDVDTATQAAVQRAFDSMILPLNNTNPNDELNGKYDVSFEYLGWPIYFDVNSNGEIIRPNSLAVSDFQFGFQQYDTYYDISFPVRVVLNAPDARNHEGYTFAFGLQGNIRGNKPLDSGYQVYSNGGAPTGTLVCNQDQYNSGDVSLTVIDNMTTKPISDVSLTFTCGSETCTVGSTDENGKWSGKLPICGGGQFVFAKDTDYSQQSLIVSTNLDEAVSLGTISLQPYRQITAAVMKKELKKQQSGQWTFASAPVALDPNEFAVVSYKQVDAPAGVDPLEGSFMYYGSRGPSNDTIIKLVPGVYEVNVQSILNSPIIIPEQVRKKKILLKTISYTIPEVSFDQFPSGALTLDEKKGYWYVTADQLDSSNAVTFYSLAPDIPGIAQKDRVIEDLQVLGDEDRYMVQQYSSLVPSFSDASLLPSSSGAGQPIIALEPLSIGTVSAGQTVPIAVSQVGDYSIKSYEIDSPVVSPAQPYTTGTINVKIPDDAYGRTKITVVFTMTDGTKVTASTTVSVTSASALSGLIVSINNKPSADSYTISKATLPQSLTFAYKITANYADSTSRDITSSDSMSLSTNDSSIIDLGDSVGTLKVKGTGQASVNASFEDQSVEVPITITE